MATCTLGFYRSGARRLKTRLYVRVDLGPARSTSEIEEQSGYEEDPVEGRHCHRDRTYRARAGAGIRGRRDVLPGVGAKSADGRGTGRALHRLHLRSPRPRRQQRQRTVRRPARGGRPRCRHQRGRRSGCRPRRVVRCGTRPRSRQPWRGDHQAGALRSAVHRGRQPSGVVRRLRAGHECGTRRPAVEPTRSRCS